MSTKNKMNHALPLSRKAFLSSIVLATCTFAPTQGAFAEIGGSTVLSDGAEAKALWESAIRRAEQEGAFVSEFVPFDPSCPIPYTSVKAAQKTVTIRGIPTVVTASASLELNGLLVASVNSAWIAATAADVSNTGYRYTKADGGRTVCITYWCSITPPHKVPATCQFYAEFHSTGSGWMKGGPV